MRNFPDHLRKTRTGFFAGHITAGSKIPVFAALTISALVLSGCVSSPGSYFETVGREKNNTRSADTSRQVVDLAVAPVESNALASIETQQPANRQPSDVPAVSAETSMTESAQGETLVASAVPIDNDSANSGPLKLGIDQNLQGDLLITPVPDLPEADFTNNVVTSVPVTDNTSAFAAPVDQQPLPGVNEQLMASTNPTASSTTAVDENGFAIGTESVPVIDPEEYAAEQRISILYSQIRHGQCKSGFGPKPKKMSATNIHLGDPYYIEIRMRKTPLLPVGHTYVAYGRLGPDGQIVDEHLIMLAPVGGYAGAALASGIPMPGILTPHRDDCRIRPETAYRVSLSAQRYEKLLLEVQKAKRKAPSYLLFANNCNHFMTRIAQSVGLKPPKNIYVPALEYIYAMIENNEGRKISRR